MANGRGNVFMFGQKSFSEAGAVTSLVSGYLLEMLVQLRQSSYWLLLATKHLISCDYWK